MPQVKNFAITAIKPSENFPQIVYKCLIHHIKSDGSLGKGILVTKKWVMDEILKNEATFKTYLWNYTKGEWTPGAHISVIQIPAHDIMYIRTDKDKTKRDNLDNILDYRYFES